MGKVCEKLGASKQTIDGQLYLLANLPLNLSLSSSITSAYISSMETQRQSLDSFFFVFKVVMITIYSLTTLLSVPILQRINNYKEKILLLVSRLNLRECETEISKLNECLTSLTSEHEDWINEDFMNIFTSSARKKLSLQKDGGGGDVPAEALSPNKKKKRSIPLVKVRRAAA